MISDERLARIVEEMRFAGGDIQLVEVKESVERLPQSMGESVSAFANAMGGVVVLGLSERYGFKPIEGFDAKRIFDSMATLCADKMTPPVRPDMRIAQFEGAAVVVAEIMEMAPVDKPCYVTDRGMYKGSFIRTGDGDRHLSQYEIDRLVEAGMQPHHDIDVVEEALPEDLRSDLVQGLLERRRSMHPRIFGGLSDREALMALNVLARGMDGRIHPTLAGLLALGVYPQHFYPRLTVSFASFPPEGEVDGSLSLPDAEVMAGPIPDVLYDTVQAVTRNDARYPEIAVREAVCNALMHRDYSRLGRGSQVQVNCYPSHLDIVSPGGMFGVVSSDLVDEVGVSSTRNQHLAELLESTPYANGATVALHRGTGFPAMKRVLEAKGCPSPVVKDTPALFCLTLFPAPQAL